MQEARLAIEYIVIPGGEPVELLPRCSEIVARQLELVESYQLLAETFGSDSNSRLQILPMKITKRGSSKDNGASKPTKQTGSDLIVSENGGGSSFSRLPFLPKWSSRSSDHHCRKCTSFLSLVVHCTTLCSVVNSVSNVEEAKEQKLTAIAFHSFAGIKSVHFWCQPGQLTCSCCAVSEILNLSVMFVLIWHPLYCFPAKGQLNTLDHKYKPV